MRRLTIFLTLALCACTQAAQTAHPSLLLTANGARQIRAGKGKLPIFDASLDMLMQDAETAVAREICLPTPKDGGGGYSHEMHKLNYYDMYNLGIAWQLSGEEKYAQKVKDILLAYVDFYPKLDFHPLGLSGNPGRIFWQTLNESVFLVHTAVAYDCVYDYLSAEERSLIEKEFFYPYTDFIMTGLPHNRANTQMFNNLNNWATWACAGVGMIGIAMGDDSLVQKALYGSDLKGEGGFLRQMDVLFSPDGYFTEGAYYLRYAIWPFVTFAQCLDVYNPELKIFEYRDGILLKAVDALLQMAYEGEFMHFNDALEKGYSAQELISAVDIAYNANPADKSLLSVVRDYQHKVLVSDAGFAVAKGLTFGEAEPLRLHSMWLRDGGDGTEGAFCIMRPASEKLNSAVTFKATSHGLSHGHFDKLTYAYYDAGNEIVTDYGAARFLNIEAKYNGHYTHENESWAKSSIAHNTLVVDGRNMFGGKWRESQKYHPTVLWHSFVDGLQCVAAREDNAYEGVSFTRYLVYADVPFLEYPLIMDVLKAESDGRHQYDYPVHYNGHMISLSVPYERALTSMTTLGSANGYQHIWTEAKAHGADGTTSYTWLTGYRMYTVSTATTPATEVYICRVGASDPDFNLRSEPMYILREKNAGNHVFASCLETHGKYDLQVEQSANLVHSCKGVTVLSDDADGITVRYDFLDSHSVTLTVSPTQTATVNYN
jgi:hypothetical protein